MKGAPNQRQHYLPKCYLRNFSEDGKSIWTYNKHHAKKFRQRMANAAQQKNFYSVPQEYIQDVTVSEDFIETDFFANSIEGLYAPLLAQINTAATNWLLNRHGGMVLNQLEKDHFAALIGIQFLRMPQIREKYWDFLERSSMARLDIIKGWVDSQHPGHKEFLDTIMIKYDQQGKSIIHATFFADEQIVNDFQDAILDKYWIFYVNEKNAFYTSNTPILLKPHLTNAPLLFEGFRTHGIEVIFPLGPGVTLTLWDKNHFPLQATQDNQFQIMSEIQVREYNSYQYLRSTDEVYALTDDFTLITLLKSVGGNKEIFPGSSSIRINGK